MDIVGDLRMLAQFEDVRASTFMLRAADEIERLRGAVRGAAEHIPDEQYKPWVKAHGLVLRDLVEI